MATFDLGYGRPENALLPIAELAKAAQHRAGLHDQACLQYGPEPGSLTFRTSLAAFLSRHYGVPVPADHLLITAGASHGLDLILAQLTKPGDIVFVEDPSYFLAFDVFKDRGIRMVPIATDEQGLDINDLERQLSDQRPAALYTIPAFHNPTGMTLPAVRRQRLVQLAKQHRFLILADEVYHILGDKERMPPPLASYDADCVLSLGSFSKILGPGVRLGWIHCSPTHIGRLITNGVLASGGGANPFVAAIIESALTLGIQDQCLQNLKEVYDRRRLLVLGLLEQLLPQEVQFVPPEGGYFVWLKLPQTIDSATLRQQAQPFDLDFKPGAIFSCAGNFTNYLRLCCTFLNEEKLEEACRRLATLLQRAMS